MTTNDFSPPSSNTPDSNFDYIFYLKVNITDAIATINAQGAPVRLVVIDPVSNYWGGTKENSNAEVRETLTPLGRIAEDTGASILLVSHFGKGERDCAQNRILGSVALTALARCVWSIYADPNDKDRRFFVPSKSNVLIDPKGLAFSITKPDGKIEILDSSVAQTADDMEAEQGTLTQATRQRGPNPERRNEAETWLLSLLQNGPLAVREVMQEAEAAGYTQSTIQRARQRLNVRTERAPDRSYYWTLNNNNLLFGE